MGEETSAGEELPLESETQLPQADLPDWLQGMAPTTRLDPADVGLGAAGVFPFATSEESASPTEPGDIPEWLREIPPAEVDAASSASQPDDLDTAAVWLDKLEEGPIVEEDTKPTRVSQANEVSIPPELSDFVTDTAPEPAVDQAPLEASTESIQEPMIDVPAQEAAEGVEEPAEGTVLEGPGLAVEAPEASGAQDVPEWLRPFGEERYDQEAPASEIFAEDNTGLWAEIPPVEEASLEPGAVEQDSAFDWLDTLSAQQDEPLAEPAPEGVEPRLDGAQIFEAAFPGGQEEVLEPVDTNRIETIASTFMSTAEPAEDMEPDAGTVPGSEDETPVESGFALPDWQYGEGDDLEFERKAGTPPAEAAEFEQAEESPLEISAGQPAEAPAELLDINQAALIDLERVPGIGLLGAQAILAYREAQGQFSTLEDLQNVPGFDQEAILQLRDHVTISSPAQAGTGETTGDWSQVALTQARSALAQSGPQEALAHFSGLIKSRTRLPEVIQDLQEALGRYADDVPLWQALGDAYARSDQLQDALDTYTKAEELLR